MNIDPNIIIASCIAATPPTIVAMLSYFASKKNSAAIEKIHIDINSRMTELLKVSKGESHAEGLAQGKLEERAENKKL